MIEYRIVSEYLIPRTDEWLESEYILPPLMDANSARALVESKERSPNWRKVRLEARLIGPWEAVAS